MPGAIPTATKPDSEVKIPEFKMPTAATGGGLSGDAQRD